MKHITYSVGAASFMEQVRKARRLMEKLHEIALECGAVWDGQDGYAFTDKQHERYCERLIEMGLSTDRFLGGANVWAEIMMQEERDDVQKQEERDAFKET